MRCEAASGWRAFQRSRPSSASFFSAAFATMISGAFGRGNFERAGPDVFAASLPGASFARDGATSAGSFAPFA